MFYIDLYRENKKIFLSDTTRPRALLYVFDMKHHLVWFDFALFADVPQKER